MSQLRALRQRLINHYRTRYLPKTGVSILSDDCWGGRVYAELGTPCRSPFVGMGFTPPEYLNFIRHLREPNALDVLSVSSAERGYPIIETPYARLFGMHFDSNESFVQRFERRKHLVDWDRLLIKIDLGKPKYRASDIEQWNAMKLPRAVAFYPDQPEYRELAIHRGVAVKNWSDDGATMFYSSCRYFDLFSFLQRGDVRFSKRRIIAQYFMFKHGLLPTWLSSRKS
jgi:uncharacterized protein (DUF1919 family)